MRDFLAATRERVVVFDGGMGATLEQFDLSLEDDYRLPGQVPRGARAQPPRRHRGRARVDGRAPAPRSSRPTPSRPAASSSTSGASASTRCEINVKAAADRPQGRRRGPLRRRLDRPDRPPARLRRPDARRDHASASSSTVFTEQAAGPGRGRRRPHHHRDRAGHPRGQGRDLRRARGVQARRAARSRSRPRVSLLPNGGKMLLGTDISAVLATLEALKVDVIGLNCSTGPEDMRDAIRFLGEHSPMPVHCIPNAGLPAPGPRRRDDLPRGARRRWPTSLGEFVERYGVSIVGGCCGTTPEHIARDRRALQAAHAVGARPAPRPPHVSLDDRRDAARAGARARRSSASASTRRARARPRSCCWPTTTTASCRSPRTRSRAARTCSTSASR